MLTERTCALHKDKNPRMMTIFIVNELISLKEMSFEDLSTLIDLACSFIPMILRKIMRKRPCIIELSVQVSKRFLVLMKPFFKNLSDSDIIWSHFQTKFQIRKIWNFKNNFWYFTIFDERLCSKSRIFHFQSKSRLGSRRRNWKFWKKYF